MTNAMKLAAIGGGGTNCSAPLARLVAERASVDLVVFVSDNQSWLDAGSGGSSGTAMMHEWRRLKEFNPAARLVCIDIQPYATVQARADADILHVGGFSDRVFDAIAMMASRGINPDHWVEAIDAIEL